MPYSRYLRQMLFREVGRAGQERLAGSTAVVVGLGALGTGVADLLARAGVGRLRLADRDYVDETNLARQTLYDEDDCRQSLPKAIAAAERLRQVNSGVQYEPWVVDVNPRNADQAFGRQAWWWTAPTTWRRGTCSTRLACAAASPGCTGRVWAAWA